MAAANLGILFAQTGRMQNAVQQFRRAVEINPASEDHRLYLGNALKDVGDVAGAVDQYSEALRVNPKSPRAALSLANALLKVGNPAEAIPHFRHCLQLGLRSPEFLTNFGLALNQTGQFEESIRYLREVTKAAPKMAGGWLNLGDGFLAVKDFPSAISAFEAGLRLSPQDAPAWASIGEALIGLNDFEGAFVAVEKSLRIQPSDHKALFLRAQILQLQKKSDLAAAGYRNLLKVAPEQSSARFNLAIVLNEQSRTAEARQEFKFVADRRNDPVAAAARVRGALSIPAILESTSEIEQVRRGMLSDLDSLKSEPPRLTDPQAEIGNPAFYLAYQGSNNRELVQKIADVLISATDDLVWTAPHCLEPSRSGSKLKVGFISAHLREHTVGRITAGLIKHLDRSCFEVVVMRPAGTADAYSSEIDATADRFVVLPADFRRAREVAAAEKLDAIYYPDIGMEPFTYYMAFSRLARVQAVGWGHADTTGIPNVDLFLSSVHFEPPNAQEQYSEKLVSLPRINCFYPRPADGFKPISRLELSLPENVPLYVCPQSAFKFHPEFDEALGAILRLDPTAVVALSSGTEPHWNELLAERFKRTIPDHFDRVRFIPRVAPEQFRGLLSLADAIIDPKHFTGGHTTYMAFADGRPVVTWDGNHMRGRMTRGLYEQMGMKGPVARDAAEFAQLAVRLATNREWRQDLSQELKEKSRSLFEDMGAVREFEKAIIDAVSAKV